MSKFASIRSFSSLFHNTKGWNAPESNRLGKDMNAQKDMHVIQLPPSIMASTDIQPELMAWLVDERSVCTLQAAEVLVNNKIYFHDGTEMNNLTLNTEVINEQEAIWERIPKLFIQISRVSMKLSSKVPAVYCKIIVHDQEYYTGKIPVTKNKQGCLVGELDLAYLFDIPEVAYTDVTVEVYSQPDAPMRRNHHRKSFGFLGSNDTLNNSVQRLGEIGRIGSLLSFKKVTNQAMTIAESEPADATLPKYTMAPGVGFLQGSMALNLSTQKNMAKFEETYTVTNGEKEVGEVTLKIGLLRDVVKKYKTPIIHRDFLNVYARTSSTMIWKKYWAILKDGVIRLFDFEYQERKPAIGMIRVTDMISVSAPNPETFSAPHSICIHMKPTFLKNAMEGMKSWCESIVDMDEYSGKQHVVHFMGESANSIREWEMAIVDSMP